MRGGRRRSRRGSQVVVTGGHPAVADDDLLYPGKEGGDLGVDVVDSWGVILEDSDKQRTD